MKLTKRIKRLTMYFFLVIIAIIGCSFVYVNQPYSKDNWVGEYYLSPPNFVETRIMLIERKMKNAYVAANIKTLHLKPDMTFVHSTTFPKKDKDTTYYSFGNWKLENKKTVLYFESGRKLYLHQSSVSKRIYFMEYLINCKDSTKGVYFINSFKKAKTSQK